MIARVTQFRALGLTQVEGAMFRHGSASFLTL
jgi:hypothetical protein